jgi:uncharacterized RDD family membrane protein YckC
MSRWYLKRGEAEVGPGSADQVRAAFKKGSLSLESMVKKEGETDWVMLKDSGILSPEETNPFVAARTFEAGGGARHSEPDPGDVKPLIRGSMFKQKPRYSRKSAPVYATFADRFVAIIIDVILLGIINYVFLGIFGGIMGSMFFSSNPLYVFSKTWLIFTYVVQLAVSGSYFVFLQHEWGYTIGRKIMGVHVEMSDRTRPDLRTFLVRYVSSLLSGFILLIGYLLALTDPKMRTLHDRMAGTIVVKD